MNKEEFIKRYKERIKQEYEKLYKESFVGAKRISDMAGIPPEHCDSPGRPGDAKWWNTHAVLLELAEKDGFLERSDDPKRIEGFRRKNQRR